MVVYISGGCKNGKSFFAQTLAKKLAASDAALYYWATMCPTDIEDKARIKRHVSEREGWGFITIEQPKDIPRAFHRLKRDDTVLFDSVTALLANEMFIGEQVLDPVEALSADMRALCKQVAHVVFVSDYIFSDAYIYDEITECYRRYLAALDKVGADVADVVIEVAYGSIIVHKGHELWEGGKGVWY